MIKVCPFSFLSSHFLVAIFSAGKDILKNIDKQYQRIDSILENLINYKILCDNIQMEDLLKWSL